jgi:hypothetical protein
VTYPFTSYDGQGARHRRQDDRILPVAVFESPYPTYVFLALCLAVSACSSGDVSLTAGDVRLASGDGISFTAVDVPALDDLSGDAGPARAEQDAAASPLPAADPGDNAEDGDAPPLSRPTVSIIAPERGAIFPEGEPVTFKAAVNDDYYAGGELEIAWRSATDGALGGGTISVDGSAELTTSALSRGPQAITVEVRNPAGLSAAETVRIGICGWLDPEPFDADLSGADWRIFGDARWDPGGWLEMTGNEKSKKGAIFKVSEQVDAGDVTISFRIWTGEGINGGADGFAMSVVAAADKAELEAIMSAANPGGCLFYGVSGACGDLAVDAFHIEFDTWRNTGDPNTDPTPSNHVAITLDGDPDNHVLWADAPTLEDASWHAVEIDIDGSLVRVRLDGAPIIDGAVPALDFAGGFIGFSGSTGYATNFHRFDDLVIFEKRCRVK